MNTGAYCWRNIHNGKVYVGGAYSSFSDRELWHRKALRGGYHFNSLLQRAWKKHGESSFVFEVLEACRPEDVAAVEQKWLDHYGAGKKIVSYNLSPYASKPPSALGKKRSAATKARMSAALKGNTNCKGTKHDEKTRLKMSKAAKLRMTDPELLAASLATLHTTEVRLKIGASLKKYYANPANLEKIEARVQERTAKAASPEWRAKMSAIAHQQWNDKEGRAKKEEGIRRSFTAERRAKVSAMKKKWAEENREKVLAMNRDPVKRAKITEALKGHPVSEETRAKLAESLRKAWLIRRKKKDGQQS